MAPITQDSYGAKPTNLLKTSFYYLTKFTQNELFEAISKKRKIEDENLFFNDQWTERYIFTDVGVKAVCLICHETVAMFKQHNLKRHFQTKHANFIKARTAKESN